MMERKKKEEGVPNHKTRLCLSPVASPVISFLPFQWPDVEVRVLFSRLFWDLNCSAAQFLRKWMPAGSLMRYEEEVKKFRARSWTSLAQFFRDDGNKTAGRARPLQ